MTSPRVTGQSKIKDNQGRISRKEQHLNVEEHREDMKGLKVEMAKKVGGESGRNEADIR